MATSTYPQPGQKRQFSSVSLSMLEKLNYELETAFCKLSTSGAQRVLAQGNILKKHLIAEAKKKMIELAGEKVGYLKAISSSGSIVIRQTDGKGTIAEAKDVFTAGIDENFKNWGLDVPSKPTKETLVQVLEMIKDGTLKQIFGSFGENLDRLCLTQHQIIQFVRNYKILLHMDDRGTFFLFKVKGEYFVAGVYWCGRELYVRAYCLPYGRVWDAVCGHRVVVSQL